MLKQAEALEGTVASLTERLEALRSQRKPESKAPMKHNEHRRQLQGDTVASLMFQHPDAALLYANGASLSEIEYDAEGGSALSANSHVVASEDVLVRSRLDVHGSRPNLGTMFQAEEDLNRGSIVSMVASGGVAKGFGMQVSTALTTLNEANSSMLIVSHDETKVSIVYMDDAHQLYAVRFDSQGSTDTPELVDPEPVEHFTAAALGPTLLVVCYKPISMPSGYCRAATHAGVWDFGDALELPQSSTYTNGVVTNLRGVNDRAVIMYSMSTPGDISSERTKAQILAITGLNTVVAQNVPRTLLTSLADHMSAVSITSDRIIVSYRVIRDENSEVREIHFRDEFRNALDDSIRVDISPSIAANLSHTALDRLDDNHAILAFRDSSNGYRVSSAIVNASDSRLLTVGPLTTVDSGAQLPEERGALRVSVTAPSRDRVGFSFLNAQHRGVFVDAGVFGQSVVMGRPQYVDEGNDMASSVAAVRMTASTSFVVYQPVNTETPRGQSVVRTTMFGGPTMLGLAKSAVTAGQSVTVLLRGALDGFSGLRPGAPYYARYDGGIGASPNELSGVSTALVGKALTPTVLFSAIGSNGDENSAALSALEKDVANAHRSLDEVGDRVDRLWEKLGHTHHGRPDLAVFRWAVWSTRHPGDYYFQDRAYMMGGLEPSRWNNQKGMAYQVASSKYQWATLFNKVMYANHNAVVFAEDRRDEYSRNSKHVGTLMRIRNTTPRPIEWTLHMYYSVYMNEQEAASVSLNGEDTWHASEGANCGWCDVGVPMTFPADRISTVLTVVSSGEQNNNFRTCVLTFHSRCLDLPDGLEWVNDLHWNTEGGWES